MKPMLKTAFYSLVNDLLARGIMPELKAYAFKYYGSLVWVEGDDTRLEHLYSAGDRKSETASIFRKRFEKWFDEIIAAYHAAAAEKLAYGQKVIDGDTVRTVTGFHTTASRDSLGNKTNGVCPRTGIIVLDGKIEVKAGAVKPFTHSDATIADAHAEALKMNDAYNTLYVYAPGDADRDVWEHMTDIEREVAVEICHANALIEDATFEENLLFLSTPEMADVWGNHTDTLKARILAAAHAEGLALDAEYGHPARFEYVNANGYKQTHLLADAHEAALAMAANYVSADQMAHEFLSEQAHADVPPMTATEAIRHMSSTLTRHMEQKLTEAQVFTLRRMMTGTKYQLRGDGKKAHENRPSIEVKRGQWFRTIDPINAPSVPVLYRLGLVDFANNRGQEPTKYYNVRLTDKGLNALAPENDMTKAPEQHDPRSLNPMKEAVPASSAIHMRVTPDRKKRYVNQARAEGLKLTDWIQKHMDNVCNDAEQPDTTMHKEVVIIHGLGQKPGNGKCVPLEVPEDSGLAKMKGKSDE